MKTVKRNRPIKDVLVKKIISMSLILLGTLLAAHIRLVPMGYGKPGSCA